MTLARKVEEDAAATIRTLAEQRGRNAELADTFVTESKSITAQEALDGNIIDLIADSERELLTRVDGMDVDGRGRRLGDPADRRGGDR